MSASLYDVRKLTEAWGTPFDVSRLLWDCKVTREDVLRCIAEEDLREEEWGICRAIRSEKAATRAHAGRIAWFIKHGWDYPIEIDVGVPGIGAHPRWFCSDGNHRLAAAVIRGDKAILGEGSGCIRTLKSYQVKGRSSKKRKLYA